MIPQLIYISLGLIGLGMTFSKHGEPQSGKHNGWARLLGVILGFSILYYGGFFNVFFK